MNKVNQLSFAGETICCGLDAHLTNWKINLLMGGMEISRFSQNPDPELLYKHLQKNYPDAKFKVVYEAGFCGFGIQRSLTKLGVECIVANAADVHISDNEHKRKSRIFIDLRPSISFQIMPGWYPILVAAMIKQL